MKVSIVIPAFNEEGYISEAVQAALNQDYPDFEVIVVDNASTDATAAVASKFPVTVVSEGKKGILHAREAGRRAATGDIIAHVDADCTPAPNWLSTGVANFSDPKVAAVFLPVRLLRRTPHL